MIQIQALSASFLVFLSAGQAQCMASDDVRTCPHSSIKATRTFASRSLCS